MPSIWNEISAVLHPGDQPPPASWRHCYEMKFALAKLLQPKTIFEIGVWAGYSALAFLRATPTARYIGIDANSNTNGGFRGAIDHARRLLASFDAEILEMSSARFATKHHHLLRAPADQMRGSGFDLIHIDGDHSFAGCLSDLQLAVQLGFRHLLLDDYVGIRSVRDAGDHFARVQPHELTSLTICDGHNGAILFTSDTALWRMNGETN